MEPLVYRRGRWSALLVLALPCALALPAAAQSSDAGSAELPPILPRAREIALARSAAPAEISAGATVMVLVRGKGYEVAEEGTNGVTCIVSRSWPKAIEPICYDREATRALVPTVQREAVLKEQGASKEAIQEDIADGYRTGRFRPPSRLAMTWMMSGAQELYNDEGNHVGAWKPHLMIFYPYLTSADLGIDGAPPAVGPMVVDEGRPTSNVIVIMPDFVKPELGEDTAGGL